MIAIDTNVTIHYLVKSQKEHSRTRRWFLKNRDPLAITHTNIAEVLRLLSHPKVFPSPLSLTKSISLLEEFLELYEVRILDESDSWYKELKELLSQLPSIRGNEVFDARIALALRYHGIREFCTLDADFSKYRFLRMVLPE